MAEEKRNINQDIQEPYDTETEQPFDSKVMEEEIEEGEIEVPQVNVESDYQASKEFSQSQHNNQETEAQQKKKPQTNFEPSVSEPSASANEPIDYKAMAKETNPRLAE